MGPINNKPAVVQIWLGAVQATRHYLNYHCLVYCLGYCFMSLLQQEQVLQPYMCDWTSKSHMLTWGPFADMALLKSQHG